MSVSSPSAIMRGLGIVQAGTPILDQTARSFVLPAECAAASAVVEELFAAMDRVARFHLFAKGMGIAAPQIGIDRRAALVQSADPGSPPIVLLNPRVTASSDECDERYEGCLSFFDVRGLVIRPLRITVEATTLAGDLVVTVFHRGLARLVCHEIDHLDGTLYVARMREGVVPIPLELYRQTGEQWTYPQ